MRYSPLLVLLLFIASCGSNDTKKNLGTDVAPVSDDPSTDQWITALRQFQQALITNDKDEMLALFPFPIDETHFFGIVHADSVSENFASQNDGKLTMAFVEKHFKTLYQTSGIADLNTVIHRINLEKLRDHGLLEGADHRKGETCFRHYAIRISGSEATITFGLSTEDNYQRAHPDGLSPCAEYGYMLRLKLINNQLRFTHIEETCCP